MLSKYNAGGKVLIALAGKRFDLSSNLFFERLRHLLGR